MISSLACDSGRFSMLAIDPGTDQMGFALAQVDLSADCFQVQQAYTFSAGRQLRRQPVLIDVAEQQGDRFARLYAHYCHIQSLLSQHRPDEVVSESPFIGSLRTHAFEALVQCVHTIREAVWSCDPDETLHLIAPQQAKAAIRAGRSGDAKQTIRDYLSQSLQEFDQFRIHFEERVVIDDLDEHSIDAIVVGYARFLQWRRDWERLRWPSSAD